MNLLKAPKSQHASGGFSLVELLVAMVIGLILLAGLVTLMVSTKKNYDVQDYSARLQENARFAIQFLSYDIRMAGFFGCSNEIIGVGDGAVNVARLGDGSNSYGDTVSIVYANTENALELQSYPTAQAHIWTMDANLSDWGETGDVLDLVVADCGGASIVKATITGDEEITLTWDGDTNFSSMRRELGRIFNPADPSTGPTMVRPLVYNEYCIEVGESQVPTLHRATSPGCDADSPELVEGVENLQLLYHDLVSGNYQDSVPANPQNAGAAKLGVLVRSVSNANLEDNPDRQYGSGTDITVDPGQNIPILGTTVSPGSLRGQRKVFNSTLLVRNRQL